MQTNLLWTGHEYYSLENCLLNCTDNGSQINSVIVGQYMDSIYRVEYDIITNRNWETTFVKIKSQQNNQFEDFTLESNGKGHWKLGGKSNAEFEGCLDVDISLTPFTNTLPINRLMLNVNENRDTKVIYIDLLQQKVTPVRQKYIRLSDTQYRYENIPNDFEATITVDDLGLVLNYPSLFVRTNRLDTDYPQANR